MTTTMPETHTGVLEIASQQHGDMKVTWNRNDPGEVAAARASFDGLVAKNMSVLRMDGDQPGKRMTEFDPDAERMVAIPAMAGG